MLSSLEAANFLVQTPDKQLHSYWRLDILLCDYAVNKSSGLIDGVTLFQKVDNHSSYKYEAVTYEELSVRLLAS